MLINDIIRSLRTMSGGVVVEKTNVESGETVLVAIQENKDEISCRTYQQGPDGSNSVTDCLVAPAIYLSIIDGLRESGALTCDNYENPHGAADGEVIQLFFTVGGAENLVILINPDLSESSVVRECARTARDIVQMFAKQTSNGGAQVTSNSVN